MTFFALMDTKGSNAELFEYTTKYNALQMMMQTNEDLFVDEESGECNFEDEEFIKILEFANREMANIVLSIDGRKEIHDKMRPFRGGQGSYDLIVPKFRKVAESRGQERYYVRGTFTRYNLDFPETYCIWRIWASGRYPWSLW